MIGAKKDLKAKILSEMTVDYAGALERNFDLAKQFTRITKEGKVEILFKERLPGTDQILLYLIGKLYAKEAGLATSEDVNNKELMAELGIPKGSLLPWQKKLRDENKIRPIKKGANTHHVIAVNRVEKILKDIEKKLTKQAA